MNSYDNFKVKNVLVRSLYYVTEIISCNIYFHLIRTVVLLNLVLTDVSPQAS